MYPDPEQIAKQYGLTLEQAKEAVAKSLKLRKSADGLTPEQMASAEFSARCVLAQEDTPLGFKHYFWCKHGMELPAHAFYGFIIPTYWAHGALTREQLDGFYTEKAARSFSLIYDKIKDVRVPKRGIVIRAAREFAKTVVVTTTLNEFRVGHHPEKTHFLLQLSQNSAKDNSAKIAETIVKSPAWKKVFPHVVPDEKAGWGAGGYYVKRSDIPEEEWTKLVSTRNAPSILGVGTGSDETIGKHPDGGATSDDVHNFANTASEREMQQLLGKLNADFTYAPTKDCWNMNVGTPWVDGDYLDMLAKSGEYLVVDVPAYYEINPDTLELEMPTHDWYEENEYVYLWPEERGADWVRLKKNTSTPAEFKRMVQLDITGKLTNTFQYQTFPAKDVQWQRWNGVVGVDPVNTVRMVTGKEGGTSHFAAAFALMTPYNNIVIADGILEKCDADRAEELLADAFRTHPTFMRASIEIDGGGILFAAIQKRLGLTVHPHSTSEIKKILKGSSGKLERAYEFLFHLLKNGLVTISDGDTPFLRAARRYFDRYPNFDPRHSPPELDVADSILLAVFDIPQVWMGVVTQIDYKRTELFAQRKPKANVWSKAGGIHA